MKDRSLRAAGPAPRPRSAARRPRPPGHARPRRLLRRPGRRLALGRRPLERALAYTVRHRLLHEPPGLGVLPQRPQAAVRRRGRFVLTDDDDTYHRVITLAHYNKRAKSEIPEGHPLARYAVTGAGLKLRIHPLAAAIAHDQLARLDGYLAGRAEIARYLTGQPARTPGLDVTTMPEGVVPSWYGLTLTYRPAELGGLPIDRFHQALIAEGATEFDLPGSTCPLNQLPLYQQPGPLFPRHPHSHRRYTSGDFPVAEQAHAHTIKLPVRHREQDLELAEQYVRAAIKISDHHKELL
ncbi:DegT/DnrJ/EryC1/StrS family aminotransferase [Kitasatospora sp. NPDC050463]|uniref:DegT/DnrJ/EryC1/StrS family aminotransferase n=1 Tax=Kitasatospora sp. NPDC050463 TaxID=3155786 RepID=UPI0034031F1C